jgi:hypothetical protein
MLIEKVKVNSCNFLPLKLLLLLVSKVRRGNYLTKNEILKLLFRKYIQKNSSNKKLILVLP